MTPAEELRLAAKTVRQAAASTDVLEEWAEYYGCCCDDVPAADRPWIALMSPALAEPLADLFDRFADVAHVFDVSPGLVVARQINGVTS